MNGDKRPKVAVIFHRLGPYHHARLVAATRQRESMVGGKFSLVAVEGCRMDRTYAWDKVKHSEDFPVDTLYDDGDLVDQSNGEVVRRLEETMNQINPTIVVIPGWTSSLALSALEWCSSRQVPAVCMSESTERDAKRSAWREAVKRRIVGLYSAGLVGGRLHKEYMVKLGMPPGSIFLGYDAVDNRYFADKAAECRKQKAEIRKRYDLPENYFLASARFVEQKNLPRLLKAYALYRTKLEGRNPNSDLCSSLSTAWDLVLLGDGPLRPDVCRLISDLRLGACVHLPGFRQYDELPVYYALAKAFIHASTMEPWGLVVNEAMATGLPVLVSSRCGCAPDLVQDGKNGFTFDPCNVEQLADLMLNLSAFGFPLSTFGDESQRIVADWGTERFARGIRAAADKAVEVGPQCATWMARVLLRLLLLF